MREAVESTIPQNEQSQKIHTHSCLSSFLCYEISWIGKDISSQPVMTLGLLHDTGKGIQVLMKRANPAVGEYIDLLDFAKLGSELLRTWGLPMHLCQMVENQQSPEFMPPDLVPTEYRREVAVLHLAHVLES
jgi:HD-like signal output (HDOD) protein